MAYLTKSYELAALAALADTLGPDSYIGPWIRIAGIKAGSPRDVGNPAIGIAGIETVGTDPGGYMDMKNQIVKERVIDARPLMLITPVDDRSVKIQAGCSYSRLTLEQLRGLRDDIEDTIAEMESNS